jgi:hypothetical protein
MASVNDWTMDHRGVFLNGVDESRSKAVYAKYWRVCCPARAICDACYISRSQKNTTAGWLLKLPPVVHTRFPLRIATPLRPCCFIDQSFLLFHFLRFLICQPIKKMSPPFPGLTSSTSPENDGEHLRILRCKDRPHPGWKQEKIIIPAVKITAVIPGKQHGSLL